MVDIVNFVNQLVATGMDKDKATEKIKKIIARIKDKKPDVEDSEIVRLIGQALALAASHKGDRFKGICIGYGSKSDRNKKYVTEALELYKANAGKAVADGFVKEDFDITGETRIIVLDTRKFLDANNKYENKNLGKPMRVQMQRRAYFIVDGTLAIVSGNIDPQIGAEYFIYGRKQNQYINVNQQGIQKSLGIDRTVLWQTVNAFAEESDFAIPLEDVSTMKPGEVKLTMGYIKNVGDTKSGGKWVTINNEVIPSGIFGFSSNEDTIGILDGAGSGNEVFAVIQSRGMSQGSDTPSALISVLGIIVNPESAANTELLGEIDILIQED